MGKEDLDQPCFPQVIERQGGCQPGMKVLLPKGVML